MKVECWYCGRELDCEIKTYAPNRYTRDHVHPVCKGGTNRLDNLVDCCWGCNMSKGKKTLEEYRNSIINKDAVGHMHLTLLRLEAIASIPDKDRSRIAKLRGSLSRCPVVRFHGEVAL